MPNRAPAKVAVSPKATRSVSWICPCGSIKTPQKSNISPPNDKMAAEMSCRCSVRIVVGIFFKSECKYAHVFEVFANFRPFFV